MDRVILHCDLNNFYASVECMLNPSLADFPVAVCGDPKERHGIVLAKNYKAKDFGVQTAEPIWQAKQKCPNLVCVLPHYDEYVKYSNIVREIYLQYTDRVEPFGMDECWLDVTHSGIFGDGTTIADRIRREVKEKTKLTISVGVSFNKIFAKLGSDLKKPDATTVLSRENFEDKIYHLSPSEMMMVGRKTNEKLKTLNILSIGQLALANEKILTNTFGVNGRLMQQYALGLDNAVVSKFDENSTIKSVGHGTTLSKDMTSFEMAKKTIYMLCEMISTRLRKYKRLGKTIHLDIRFTDLTHKSMQRTICIPTMLPTLIASTSCEILEIIWNPHTDKALRSLTVSVGSLVSSIENIQENLFFPTRIKDEKLQYAIDAIREKHGYESVTRGLLLADDFVFDEYNSNQDLIPFSRHINIE